MNQKYSKTITLFTITGVFWAAVAGLVGLLAQTQLLMNWPSPEAVNYGLLRPLYTSLLLFGSGFAFMKAIGYFAVKGEYLEDLRLEGLALAGWAIHQLGMAFGLMMLIGGANSGREFGEFSVIANNLLILSLIIFLAMMARGLKSVPRASAGSTLIVLGLGGGLATFFIGNFAQPYSFTGSVPLFTGVQDTATQEYYQAGFLGFFLLLPAFAALYTAVTRYGESHIDNEGIAKFQALAMTLVIPFTGAAFLAYTFAPGAIQSVGMFAVFALFVAILGGFLNVQATIGKSGKSDMIVKHLQVGNILLLVWAVLRSIAALPVFQKQYGFTAWNMTDIAMDFQTYGLLIFAGAAIVMMQKETGKKASASLQSIQFLLLVAGSVLLLAGDIGSGVLQASAQGAMDAEGNLAAAGWSAVRPAAGGLGLVSLLGQLSVFLGTVLTMVTVMSTTSESAEPTGEAAV